MFDSISLTQDGEEVDLELLAATGAGETSAADISD